MIDLVQSGSWCAGQPNLLLMAAYPLLNAISHFRYAPAPEDPAALRQRMINEIRRFEKICQGQGLANKTIEAARYCLCTSLDEAAALTEWGKGSIWTGDGLLVTFHNESGGGEQFFQLMETLLQQPERNINLLELIYFCLLLGFGGRYRVMENGIYRLEIITQRLAQQIRRLRGDYPQPLSGPLAVSAPSGPPPRGRVGLLVWSLVCVISLSALYIGLDAQLDNIANRVSKRIFSLPLPRALPATDTFSLPTLLQTVESEIARKKMTVNAVANQVTITLCGGDLFRSASARLDADYYPILRRIGRQLSLTSGTITVRGHSDDQKIATADFPSNHALALARAESVARLLRQELTHPNRIITQSAVGAPPLVPNDTATNRAINRRIDMVFSINPADRVAP